MGALIAALVSAGYTSDEMLSIKEPIERHGIWRRFRRARRRLTSNVLDTAEVKKVMHLFGPWRWRFYLFRWFINHPLPVIAGVALVWLVGLILFHGLMIGFYPRLPEWLRSTFSGLVPPILETRIGSMVGELVAVHQFPTITVLVVGFLSLLFVFAVVRVVVRGIFTTDRLAYAVDRALAAKLVSRLQDIEKNPDGRPGRIRPDEARRLWEQLEGALRGPRKSYTPAVTFRMMRNAECRPLAIAATNINRSAVKLFSSDATPEELVARAVAASAAVPFLFRPVLVIDGREEQFLFDGGVTSNLPAWPYDVPRELNPDLYTLAIEIPGRHFTFDSMRWRISNWLFQPFRQLRALINATIFGARVLETRRTRAIAVQLDTAVDLLHFDMSTETAISEMESARRCFRSSLNLRIARRQLYASICQRICATVREHLRESPTIRRSSDFKPRIRVRLLKPLSNGARALKSEWHCSSDAAFQGDTDDRLLFRKGTSVPGRAWETRRPQLVEVGKDPGNIIWDDFNPEQHRYAHRLNWAGMEWMLAIFVPRDVQRSRESTDWVVVVDSNIQLKRFEFSAESMGAIVAPIMEVAKDLSLLEDRAHEIATRLDGEMQNVA